MKKYLLISSKVTDNGNSTRHHTPSPHAVRGGENKGDNSTGMWRDLDTAIRKHKIFKWDDIKFTAVDAAADGGQVGMGGGQTIKPCTGHLFFRR